MTNHICLNHLDRVRELLSREPLPLLTVRIRDVDRRFRGLPELLAMGYEDLELVGYQSHGKIAPPVAI